MTSRVALLCGADDNSAAVANALTRAFGEIAILVECKEPRSVFLKRRIRRLGLLAVLGQTAFVALLPLLRRRSANRVGEIIERTGLDMDHSLLQRATQVSSVNAPETVEWLREQGAAVVVVNGTRIIARRVLEASDAVFINTHCGITPEYRGVHGGYWALYRSDPENCGVTVHLVDPGIDTGGILAQQRIEPGPRDNFVTYPYLQLAAGLPLLVEAVGSALEGRHIPRTRDADGGLWFHPTVWQYLWAGIRRSVW
jgi:phosphoribosylglycinamide formyltransferase-1